MFTVITLRWNLKKLLSLHFPGGMAIRGVGPSGPYLRFGGGDIVPNGLPVSVQFSGLFDISK